MQMSIPALHHTLHNSTFDFIYIGNLGISLQSASKSYALMFAAKCPIIQKAKLKLERFHFDPDSTAINFPLDQRTALFEVTTRYMYICTNITNLSLDLISI
mmetsp:Transcript_9933/g.12393  ORF Transcript_9933/g.12393 Transcript_9933/m.12393 type:complete len:101 (-) Transcript_9933:69-371(-)